MTATSISDPPMKRGVHQGNQGATIPPARKKSNNDGHQSWVSGQSGSRAYKQNNSGAGGRCRRVDYHDACRRDTCVGFEFPLTLKLPLIALIPVIEADITGVSFNQGKIDSPDTLAGYLIYVAFRSFAKTRLVIGALR
jgi:hypothetical protein